MDALGLRDEFSGRNQLRKTGRIIKVSCVIMIIGRKRSHSLVLIIVVILLMPV